MSLEMNEFNYIHTSLPQSDVKLFFYDDSIITWFDDTHTMLDILVLSGVFKTKTQARKNLPPILEENINIPFGWFQFIAGKKRTIINIVGRETDAAKLITDNEDKYYAAKRLIAMRGAIII